MDALASMLPTSNPTGINNYLADRPDQTTPCASPNASDPLGYTVSNEDKAAQQERMVAIWDATMRAMLLNDATAITTLRQVEGGGGEAAQGVLGAQSKGCPWSQVEGGGQQSGDESALDGSARRLLMRPQV